MSDNRLTAAGWTMARDGTGIVRRWRDPYTRELLSEEDALRRVEKDAAGAANDDAAPLARKVASRPASVYVAPLTPMAETHTPTAPLARQAREALRPKPEDPELVTVRTLLADLRPDAPDPTEPPPTESGPAPTPYLRLPDSTPAWDRLPRGLGQSSQAAQTSTAWDREDVFAKLATMPVDARGVLRWLRDHATLREGLRGLYVDAGLRFASDDQRTAWEDLTVRRFGAPAHGRALVLAAERAWRGGEGR